jgi:hypothetical protein
VMLTIMWSSMGFAAVIALESGCKFNAGYYVSRVLTVLSEWQCKRRGEDFAKMDRPCR